MRGRMSRSGQTGLTRTAEGDLQEAHRWFGTERKQQQLFDVIKLGFVLKETLDLLPHPSPPPPHPEGCFFPLFFTACQRLHRPRIRMENKSFLTSRAAMVPSHVAELSQLSSLPPPGWDWGVNWSDCAAATHRHTASITINHSQPLFTVQQGFQLNCDWTRSYASWWPTKGSTTFIFFFLMREPSQGTISAN